MSGANEDFRPLFEVVRDAWTGQHSLEDFTRTLRRYVVYLVNPVEEVRLPCAGSSACSASHATAATELAS